VFPNYRFVDISSEVQGAGVATKEERKEDIERGVVETVDVKWTAHSYLYLYACYSA
jgi:hypothetical protein